MLQQDCLIVNRIDSRSKLVFGAPKMEEYSWFCSGKQNNSIYLSNIDQFPPELESEWIFGNVLSIYLSILFFMHFLKNETLMIGTFGQESVYLYRICSILDKHFNTCLLSFCLIAVSIFGYNDIWISKSEFQTRDGQRKRQMLRLSAGKFLE